uniref:Uncharacterized protein n=1 Tax=Panagrolaimus sp. PS1159 TaxID=55785 RepID=A0AC35G040_9BILA
MKLQLLFLYFFIIYITKVLSDENYCQCHDMPSCRCDKTSCHCKQRATPPCICRIPSSNTFEDCTNACKPTCLGSCILFNPASACETTCTAACNLACPQQVKRQQLSNSLTFTCVNDCAADCILSNDYRKQSLLDGKAKLECESNCKSSCEQTVTMAINDLSDESILFAVKNVNLKDATYSKYDCSQHCISDCGDKCKSSGAPDEICVPTCDGFCSEKCDINYSVVPQAVCMKGCQPECDRKCVLDKTLDIVFGFVETTKNFTAHLPSLSELFNPTKIFASKEITIDESRMNYEIIPPTINQEIQQQQNTQQINNNNIGMNELPLMTYPPIIPATTEQPLEIKLPQIYHSYNCHKCLPSCNDQCEGLNRPGLNCTRLCMRTCDLNCLPALPQVQKTFHSYTKEEMQSKCREQLTLKCSTLCKSPECQEICANAVRFLCARSAECNGVCQNTCKQHCLVKDKAFAQCEPSCTESCQRECRLSDEIRSECQNNCMGNCGKKCEITSPNVPLMFQCNTNCPQLCHSVCYE